MAPPNDDDLGRAPTASSDAEPSPAADAGPPGGFRTVAVGATVGRYELIEELGEGGMATVYRARDKELRRDVAIKVLFPHLARRAELVLRFDREARAAAGLEHPNILRVYDVGGATRDGEGAGPADPPYIVMELVRGQSLKEVVEARGPLLAELAACAGALLADALAAAHVAGVVHRDVKPANVMVGPGGRILLADFGVARVDDDDSLVTRTGALLGTPAFMSPEQATGAPVDPRTDVYSLGATLYQLATGHLPHVGSAPRVVAAIARGDLTPPVRRRPAVGAEMSRLIERLMATEPDGRPRSAEAAAGELRALVTAAGLGDPADELAAYFADPDGYARATTSAVSLRLVERARSAHAAGKLARALALIDRATALAPGDPAIATLAEELSRRRGGGWLVAAGLGTVALAIAAAVALWRGGATGFGADAAVADAASADGAGAGADAVVVSFTDAATGSGPDASRLVALPRLDGPGRGRNRGRGIDAAIAIAPLATSPDAAAGTRGPSDATWPRTGKLVVVMDSWCDLAIDGAAARRLVVNHAYELAAGVHQISCANVSRTFRAPVTVVAGETVTVRGSVLGEVTITFATRAAVSIAGTTYRAGDQLVAKPGRLRVIVDGRAVFVDIPDIGACRLDDTGVPARPIDCFR